MDTEEFSFPKISETCSHNIDSPPLWNLSPAASPKLVVAEAHRKSFSYEEEEKMDMLWEDFNEDLLYSRTTTTTTTTTGSATSSSREVVELRCASSLTVAKTRNSSSLVSSKNKHGMVVFVKVMKKLFSISNSQGKSRNRVR